MPLPRIPPDANVLARDVRGRRDADVDWIGDAAAADRHRIPGHLIGVIPGIVLIRDSGDDRSGR